VSRKIPQIDEIFLNRHLYILPPASKLSFIADIAYQKSASTLVDRMFPCDNASSSTTQLRNPADEKWKTDGNRKRVVHCRFLHRGYRFASTPPGARILDRVIFLCTNMGDLEEIGITIRVYRNTQCLVIFPATYVTLITNFIH